MKVENCSQEGRRLPDYHLLALQVVALTFEIFSHSHRIDGFLDPAGYL